MYLSYFNQVTPTETGDLFFKRDLAYGNFRGEYAPLVELLTTHLKCDKGPQVDTALFVIGQKNEEFTLFIFS